MRPGPCGGSGRSSCAAAPAGPLLPRARPPRPRPRDRILLAALGSPDPYGRQLDGLGGGISSLSKVSSRRAHPPEADVDYTFAQVEVNRPRSTTGATAATSRRRSAPSRSTRASSAARRAALVRIHNTNTGKIIHASFAWRTAAPRSRARAPPPGRGRDRGAASARLPRARRRPDRPAAAHRLAARDESSRAWPALFESLVDATNPGVFVAARPTSGSPRRRVAGGARRRRPRSWTASSGCAAGPAC